MYLTRVMPRVVGTLVFLTALLSAQRAFAACEIGPTGTIRHVVHIQLDSVQFQRPNPNVPSDLQRLNPSGPPELEQIPHLLRCLRSNASLSTSPHTLPAAWTATNVLNILTG